MEGERSSHTVTTTQLSHWQETCSIPDCWTLLKLTFTLDHKHNIHDSEFMGESAHGMGKYGSGEYIFFFLFPQTELLQLLM